MVTEPHSNGRDRTWIVLLALSFLCGLAVSWQRWGNPLIDTGREMNVPLRLAGGESLYSDIRHIYGPLSPWLHAALYRVFGPSLAVLYADGIACAALASALVYWLSRQIMSPAAAGAATLSFVSLCVFKPSGNYMLPYSFNALHGTVLGLATLAVLARSARSSVTIGIAAPVRRGFLLAGVFAGLTLLAKTEMGVAAIAAGAVAAALAGPAGGVRRIHLVLFFLMPAGCLTVATYGAIAARVGWSTLAGDNWLLAYNMAPEVAAYNQHLAGLDRPLYSLWRVLLACVKLGILATIVASAGVLLTGPRPRTPREAPAAPRFPLAAFVLDHPGPALAAAIALVMLSVTTGLDWDKGPYLAMPVLLVALIASLARNLQNHGEGSAALRSSLLLVYAVYALVSLARIALHVQSGGGYASYLLPMSIVIFTYLWVAPLAGALPDARAARATRCVALGLILTSAIVTAILVGVRYRTRSAVAITSSRGTMITERDVGVAWNEALAYIEAHTRPGDPIAVLPEGTSLTFLSGRRNPLREEIITPGFLDGPGEARAIRQLQEARTRLVLVTNRRTAEFGPDAFGRDYCPKLMGWMESHYRPCAMFGTVKDSTLQVGDRPFFIRAYCPPDAW